MAFEWSGSDYSIRNDLRDAYRAAWEHIARPGTWLTGAQRVAVAEETRRARSCRLCAERKASLSPFAPSSAGVSRDAAEPRHDDAGVLAEAMVDEVHRITTDAARLTRSWVESLITAGLSYEEYVETLGVSVITISIDRFHHALGLPLEPLPPPQAGEPSREPVSAGAADEAFVPMLSPRRTSDEIGMRGIPAPNVLRALSLVPAEVRAWRALAAAQYLDEADMMRFDSSRVASRSQIELVAGRVSALNECFYWTSSHAAMLRASIEFSGSDANVDGIAKGAQAGDQGIEHGQRLTAFVDAALGDDPALLKSARDALRAAGGAELLVDAAGVIGNFERMVRIADGAGIPLDEMAALISGDLQERLGLDRFESRRLSTGRGIGRRLGPLLRPVIHAALRFTGKRSRKRRQD